MRPHPFALVLAGALAVALVAAALAPDRAPAIALYWNPVYRAEIALVVLALAYLLGVVGWMAWNGQAFRRIELPGGTALERDASELDSAATTLSDYKASVDERFATVDEAIAELNARLEQLEGGSKADAPRVSSP